MIFNAVPFFLVVRTCLMFVYKLLIEKKNCTVKSLMDPPSFTLLGAYIPEWPNMRRLQMFGQLSRVKRWVYGSTHVHHVVQLYCILMLCIYIWKLTNEDTKKLKAKQGSEKKVTTFFQIADMVILPV